MKDSNHRQGLTKILRALFAGAASVLVPLCGTALFLAARPAAAQTGTAGPSGKLSPLQLLQAAHTSFAQRDYESARRFYLQVLPSYPNNLDVLQNLAFCYFSMGRTGFAQAARYYARAYEIEPNSRDIADKLATCYMALRRPAEAAAVLRKLADRPEAPPEAWRRAAEAYSDAGRPSDAETAYDVYLQRRPGDLAARAQLGILYGQQKDYNKAMEQFRLTLSSNPNYSPALIGMGRILSWQGQYEESVAQYDRVLRLNPSNGEALSGKAFVLLWMGRAEEAEPLFSKLHQRYPKDDEVSRGLEAAQASIEQKNLAQARRTGNVARVEALYRDRLSKNPQDLDALKVLISLTSTPNRCAESIGFARRALEISPDEAPIELTLARSLALCQQYAEAIARYKRYLEARPKAEDALFELAQILFRTRRIPEATQAFRDLMQVNPRNQDASQGLAQCLASSGNYQEALVRYDEVLKTSPDNYDALQGKAYILYWTEEFSQARAIFESLAAQRPSDPQNTQALEDIARAEESARWAEIRPAPGSPPKDFVVYYQKRLASYPDDVSAMKGLAYSQSQSNNLPDAIEGYGRVLDKNPDDLDAQKELARLFGQNGQYDKSIHLYESVVKNHPDDKTSAENLGRVYLWAGRPAEALPIYQGLLAKDPANTGLQMQVARLELRLKNYPAAREVLASVISAEPDNREARLALAQLDFAQGRREESLKNYDQLLKQNPNDPDALLGKAQISYYQGDMPQAQSTAEAAVNQRPQSFDAVFLLANVEHARGHRGKTKELLNQAAQISPGNLEVEAMKQRVRQESAVTLHTSVSYTREIGAPSEFGTRQGLPNEDLRMFSYGATVGLSLFHRTDSYFSFTSMPTDAPPGPFRDPQGNQIPTGITGAAAPAQFLYRQNTRVSPKLTVRGGVGAVQFGPGIVTTLPGQPGPVISATSSVIGQAGVSIAPSKKFSVDLGFSRSPLAYTPVSAKFGLIEQSANVGLNFFFTKRAELHLDYSFEHYSTAKFASGCFSTTGTLMGPECHDQGHRGQAEFIWNLISTERFSFDTGYDGTVYGFAGKRRNIFLGFFNPSFYQRHLATGRIYGKLVGPVGYDIAGGFGVQQSGQGNAITRGLHANPAFTLRVSDHLTLGVGYTYYNTAQALGPLRGNGVRFTTDWKFY